MGGVTCWVLARGMKGADVQYPGAVGGFRWAS